MPERVPERIAARRAARRRQLRRRRLMAAGGLAAAIVAIVLMLVANPFGGGSGGDPAGPGGKHKAGGASGPGGNGNASGGPGQGPNASEDSEGEAAAQLLRNAREQPDWRPHTGPVPILMYHVIEDPPASAPYPDLYVSAEDFRAQIEWLAEQGYEAVTLRQVERAWWRGGRLPEKPIVLSFDDGYVSQYEVAFKAMGELGWPGLLNLKAGETDIYKRQVREMVAAGWELGSHTVDHPDLTTLDPTALAEELTRSRRILRRRFGVPVTHLCYPAGRYNDAVVAATEAAGYTTATTTDPGLAESSDPYRLKRIRVNRGDGPGALAAAGL